METPPIAPVEAEEELAFWDKHRYMLLITVTIIISLLLVVISLVIYNVSGSAQLDLSRPGYQTVSDQVEEAVEITEYGAFGPVNKETVDEFKAIYKEQAAKAKAIDAFNGDPLNPELLEFGTTASE